MGLMQGLVNLKTLPNTVNHALYFASFHDIELHYRE